MQFVHFVAPSKKGYVLLRTKTRRQVPCVLSLKEAYVIVLESTRKVNIKQLVLKFTFHIFCSLLFQFPGNTPIMGNNDLRWKQNLLLLQNIFYVLIRERKASDQYILTKNQWGVLQCCFILNVRSSFFEVQELGRRKISTSSLKTLSCKEHSRMVPCNSQHPCQSVSILP